MLHEATGTDGHLHVHRRRGIRPRQGAREQRPRGMGAAGAGGSEDGARDRRAVDRRRGDGRARAGKASGRAPAPTRSRTRRPRRRPHGGWSPRSSRSGTSRKRVALWSVPVAHRNSTASPAPVATFATLGFVPSCSAMPRAARAAAASSRAASRSADPAGTPPRRTTYVVMSLGASPVDSGGSKTQERSVTATDSRRMACSPLFACSRHDRRARRAVVRDTPRRAIPSDIRRRRRPVPGRRGRANGRTDGLSSVEPTASVQDSPAPDVLSIGGRRRDFHSPLRRRRPGHPAATPPPPGRPPCDPADPPASRRRLRRHRRRCSSERCSTCGTSAIGRSPGSSSSARRGAARIGEIIGVVSRPDCGFGAGISAGEQWMILTDRWPEAA